MAESKEKIEDLIRERFSADRGADERRMDTFARLLSGRSACVSITLVGKQFYITANEFFQGTQPDRNEGYKSIEAVMKYFCTLAKEDVDEAAEQAIFRKICEERLKGLGTEKPVILPGMIDAIVDSVLSGKDPTILELMETYGESAQIAGFLQGEFRNLYRDFLKLRTSVIAKRNGVVEREDEITQGQFEALSSKRFHISIAEPRQHEKVKKESRGKGKGKEEQEGEEEQGKKSTTKQKPVHAEVQLLSNIVNLLAPSADKPAELKKDVPQKFYVGISKLCCLNCRVMLEVANEVFKENNIQITLETRGKHDLDFAWIPPKLFEEGYNLKRIEDAQTLEQKIGYLTKKRVELLKAKNAPTGVSMGASQSSSDDEGVVETDIQDRKESLETKLALMQELQRNFSQQMTTEEIRELLLIAIELHKLKRFSDVCKTIDAGRKLKPGTIQKDFANLLQDLRESKLSSLTQEKLLQVLQSATLVGTAAIGYFGKFSLAPSPLHEEGGEAMLPEGSSSRDISLTPAARMTWMAPGSPSASRQRTPSVSPPPAKPDEGGSPSSPSTKPKAKHLRLTKSDSEDSGSNTE
jgi:hypothetical protein